MPTQTTSVPAELYFEYKGIKLYCTYKNDDIDNGPCMYTFVLNEWDDLDTSFDVRKLEGWKEPKHPPFLIGKEKTEKNEKRWKKYHNNCVEEKHIEKFLKKCIDEEVELKYA